jgi:DNA recombination protein RmuC
MATVETFTIIAIVLVGFSALGFYLLKISKELKHSREQDPTLIKWLNSMQQSVEKTNISVATILNQNNKNVTDTLNKSSEAMSRRLEHVSNLFNEVTKEVSKMNETGETVKRLHSLMQTPKLRGNLGEELLADMLKQVLPNQYILLQHTFKSGHKVDAGIKTTAGILCIDSKFPLENFQKKIESETVSEQTKHAKQFAVDVKKHIKVISQKYILPEEGTLDFAFMYVPSEGVFHEVVNNAELMSLARSQRIYPVSPNTLYAHLQTVLLAFEGQKFEKKAKQVMQLLQALQKDYLKVEENLQVLGKHLNNASSQFQNAQSQFQQIGQKLSNRELLES